VTPEDRDAAILSCLLGLMWCITGAVAALVGDGPSAAVALIGGAGHALLAELYRPRA
jgi:hypothetical protein